MFIKNGSPVKVDSLAVTEDTERSPTAICDWHESYFSNSDTQEYSFLYASAEFNFISIFSYYVLWGDECPVGPEHPLS